MEYWNQLFSISSERGVYFPVHSLASIQTRKGYIWPYIPRLVLVRIQCKMYIAKSIVCLREAIGKKSRLVMEFFRKGSDPPPPYFRKLWNPWGTFEFWSPKKGKNITSQKHPKWPYLKNLFKKSAQKCPKPSILNKKTLTLEAQKCASKVMDWVKTPPPLRKNSITNLICFSLMASLSAPNLGVKL